MGKQTIYDRSTSQMPHSLEFYTILIPVILFEHFFFYEDPYGWLALWYENYCPVGNACSNFRVHV